MLNILGYEIDTTNTPWATAVMAKSSTIGLLKNVSTAAGSACPRQEAAQIIYNALTLPILEANQLGVLVPSTDTILTKYLGGSSDVVVVTGNEYADLNGSTPLDEGKTEVNNGTTLNWSTTLDMIGQSYKVWTVGNTVVYSELASANIWETNEATTPDGITAKQTGMKLTDADQYINFAKEYETTYTADIRISYVYDEDGDGALTGETVKSIDADKEISTDTLKTLETIFKTAAYETVGYVTIGTKSATAVNDISNSMKWSAFMAEYINADTTDTINAKVNENGNYIKVIDNDGDGYADYILKTKYVLDQITDIETKGSETTYGFYTLKTGGRTGVTADVLYDDAAVNDVVVYALIDGVAYIEKAETAVATVKTVSFKNDTITTTDGDTYGQSGIGNDTGYAEYVRYMDDDVEYNLYFDKYGYVRAYSIVEGESAYALLTELYYTNQNNSKYLKQNTPVVELTAGAEATAEYVVLNSRDNEFDGTTDRGTTVKGIHNANYLVRATASLALANNSEFLWTESESSYSISNVAKYVLTDDGVKITTAAKYAYNKAGEQLYYQADGSKAAKPATDDPVYAVNYIQLSSTTDIAKGARQYTTASGNNDHVNAVHATEYYLINNATGKISYFTDYTNVPKIDADNINAIYAVAENTTADSSSKDYWVADVIVIEVKKLDQAYDSISLAYYNPSKTSGDVKYLDTLNNKVDDVETQVVPGTEGWSGQFISYGFYELYNTEEKSEGVLSAASIDLIEKGDYNKHGIYAGTIDRINAINSRGGYIEVYNGKKSVIVDTYNVPIYSIERNTASLVNAKDVEEGDQIIYVMNGTSVAYIVDLGSKTNANIDADSYVSTIYTDIMAEQTTPAGATYTVNGVGAYSEGDKVTVNASGEFVKVTVDGVDSYVAVENGKATITITTGDVTTTDGYYDFKLNDETYYVTSSDVSNINHMSASDLATAAGVTLAGTTYKWTYDTGLTTPAAYTDPNTYLDLVNYAYNELTDGYFTLTWTPADYTVTVNGDTVTSGSEEVQVDDVIVAIENATGETTTTTVTRDMTQDITLGGQN
jgi:hypothetical protein